MLTVVKDDLFSAPRGLICHQVNCRGNMGRGVAKTFKEKYPQAFKEYSLICQVSSAATLLGICLFNKEDNNIISCSMFAQDDWRGHNVCNTDYNAFTQCCREIRKYITLEELPQDFPINMPYGIGAGLGGGDWLIIQSIIEEQLVEYNYNVILWKLPT